MKKLSVCLLALLCVLSLWIPAFAEGDLIVDDADLLTWQEEADLQLRLQEIRENYEFEVVLVTVQSLGGQSAQDYADDYFDYNGYGYGPDDDGMLLLVAMDEREYHISTHAFGLVAFTDYGLDEMEEAFVPYLSQEDYKGAFEVFLEFADIYLYEARNNDPVDIGDEDYDFYEDVQHGIENAPMTFGAIVSTAFSHIGGFLAIGLIAAIITVLVMKSALKTIRSQAAATDYHGERGLQLSVRQDTFLYSRTTKTRIDNDSHSGSSGGGSSHSSSSGRSHGGSGGRF